MKQIILLVALLLSHQFIQAQPGTLDSSFGENGKVITPFEGLGFVNASLLLNNNAIITGTIRGTGQPFGFFLVKYSKDGIIDSSFGYNGTVLTFFDNYNIIELTSFVLQKDGKIIAVGTAVQGNGEENIALARYFPDGRLDSSFGVNGKVTTDFGFPAYGQTVSIQEDNKIVVGANKYSSDYSTSDFLVSRYLHDGSLDESFGDGEKMIPVLIGGDNLKATAIQKDGKILAAGTNSSNAIEKFEIIRLLPSGSMDSAFDENGVVTTDFGIDGDEINDIVLQEDQKIIAIGNTGRNGQLKNWYIAVARYNSNGSLDNSFGVTGKTTIKFNDWDMPNCVGNAVALQKDGKIVVAGYNTDNTMNNFAIARLLTNGIIDSSFAINGTQVTDLGQDFNTATSVHIQSDGKIVATGYTNFDISPVISVALARYYGDPVKKEQYVKIKRWLHHHGFTWEDKPGNDISYYSIQRSSNNGFTEIARIFNRGNSQQSFEDASAATGTYSYRVAAVTESGNITYSNTIAIESNTANIKVYPNPVKNSLQIEGLPANTKTKLTVTDLTGTARIVTTINCSTYTLNVALLTKGNYMIKIESCAVVVTKQFIKE